MTINMMIFIIYINSILSFTLVEATYKSGL